MLNYGCTLLDVGDYTIIESSTQIYTACHSLNPTERKNNIEFGKPVTIEKNVWIGGGVIILPGITIGDNPCKVVREIKEDS